MTVAVCPAMVRVPARAAAVVLAVAENWTAPDPEPLEPDVIERNGAPAEAVHEQTGLVRTPTVADPAVAAINWLPGESV